MPNQHEIERAIVDGLVGPFSGGTAHRVAERLAPRIAAAIHHALVLVDPSRRRDLILDALRNGAESDLGDAA